MSLTQTTAGIAMLVIVGTAFLEAVVPEVSEQPTITVHDLSWNGEKVVADREIHNPPYDADFFIMDWEVVVFSEGRKDGAICKTVDGPDEHEGWSRYFPSERAAREFTMDVWVNDPGCEERLVRGEVYTQKVTWTPDDGRAPVTAFDQFTY